MLKVKNKLVGKIKNKATLKGKLNNATIYVKPELQDLVVTPSEEQQIFIHENSYGYDKVTVEAYQIPKYAPKYISFRAADSTYTNGDLTYETRNLDTSNLTTMYEMFRGASVAVDVSEWDTSNVTNMGYAFYQAGVGSSLDVSNWDVSNVTNMAYMFQLCNIPSIDITRWNTSNVTNMENMFNNCSKLTSIDVSKLDTSNVHTIRYMFSNCGSLTTLDVSNLDLSNVDVNAQYKYGLSNMFTYCDDLSSLKLFKVGSNITTLAYMFQYCKTLTELDFTGWDTSGVTRMDQMFRDCKKLKSLDMSMFDTSAVTNMYMLFYGCTALESLDISSFTSEVCTNCSSMFSSCISLKYLDIRNFDFTTVTTTDNYVFGSSNGGVPSACEIIVMDDAQRNWILTKRSDFTNIKTVAEYEGG